MVKRTMSAVNEKEIEEGKFHLDSLRYAMKHGRESMRDDSIEKIVTSLFKIIEMQQTQINQLQNNLEG